jgi:hypothetical protein
VPTPRTLPASNGLQQPRSTLNEAEYTNYDPHALTQGGHSLRVLATRHSRKNRTTPSSDYRNQGKSATTKEKLLSKNTQPSLIDLAIKHNSTGDPSTSAIPTGQSLGNLLFAPTTTKSKTKQQKKTPTSPDLTPEGTTAPQPKGWENKTSTTGDQWDDESHPSPHGLEGRPAPGGGDVKPPPPK